MLKCNGNCQERLPLFFCGYKKGKTLPGAVLVSGIHDGGLNSSSNGLLVSIRANIGGNCFSINIYVSTEQKTDSLTPSMPTGPDGIRTLK